MAMVNSAVVKAISLLLSLSLFSFLAKEQHIASAALLLGPLSTVHYTRIQQRRIEKLKRRVQRSTNYQYYSSRDAQSRLPRATAEDPYGQQ